jgi:hypothetical protein
VVGWAIKVNWYHAPTVVQYIMNVPDVEVKLTIYETIMEN